MLTLDILSDSPLPEFPNAALLAPHHTLSHQSDQSDRTDKAPHHTPQQPLPQQGEFWLDGAVVMCGCPDCHAPMTVRIWLMVADCWQCGTSIELTEEQERQVRELLERNRRRQDSASESERRQDARRMGPLSRPTPIAIGSGQWSQPTSPSRSQPVPAATALNRARVAQAVSSGGVVATMRSFFNMTPAWLVSLIFHLILLTLLALWSLMEEKEDRFITLSTTVSRDVQEGVEQILDPQDNAKFDLPIPSDADLSNEKVREALQAADQQARELRTDPDALAPLPDLERVKLQMHSRAGVHRSFLARDPRLRVEMIKKEGGTTLTEAAVARGLHWLAKVQNVHARGPEGDDGSWSLHRFGGIHCDAAGTSLALMPFLGAGQTHLHGRYKNVVAKGLRWMLERQLDNGDLRAGETGQPGMYAHGQAAIVLCEAFAMTGDEQFRIPAQKSLDFIIKAQHPGGGWRYRPGDEGDTSVLGWQLMALQSGRAANLNVPTTTLELASHFLDTVADGRTPQYRYRPRGHANGAMTAEALLCRIYLGWRKDTRGLVDGVEYMMQQYPPQRSAADIYYWYYGTQTMHHYGGPLWERWNHLMRDYLVGMQEDSGRYAGSWAPTGVHVGAGGRIYMTALAICCLEVYYRHLPIFRQIKVE